jgi:hypothetical protein
LCVGLALLKTVEVCLIVQSSTLDQA